jgi:hypothetical protein
MSEKDKDLATVERTIEILEQWNMDPMMGTWYATNSETVRSILGALDAAQEVAARHRFPNQRGGLCKLAEMLRLQDAAK